jgi:hypothetical protein
VTTPALIFMVLSWTFVLGLLSWSYYRILTHKKHFDPDGIGPAAPPEPALFDPQSGGEARGK